MAKVRVWLLMAALLMLGAPAAAVERLAVLELSGDAIPADQRAALTNAVRGGVTGALGDTVQVMTRENMEVMLSDMGIDASCIAEGACEVETARNLGVDYVVSGNFTAFGEALVVSLSLHDTGNGRLLSSVQTDGESAFALLKSLGDSAVELVKGLVVVPGVEPVAVVEVTDAEVADVEVLSRPETSKAAPTQMSAKEYKQAALEEKQTLKEQKQALKALNRRLSEFDNAIEEATCPEVEAMGGMGEYQMVAEQARMVLDAKEGDMASDMLALIDQFEPMVKQLQPNCK